MKKEQMLDRLVNNALGFLSKAISELEEYPKYSVIHFYSAVELLLKARLMAEHWTLVVTRRQDPDWEKFISGDFQSVSLREAADRLSKVVRSGLSERELKAFEDVGKHRNRMVHFYHEAHAGEENNELRQRILKQQLVAWHFLNRLLVVRWKEVFETWSGRIADTDKALRQLHDFLQVVFEDVSPKIEELKGRGIQVDKCPSCGFMSHAHVHGRDSIYEVKCLVCDLAERCLEIQCPKCNDGARVVFRNEGFSTCDSCNKEFEPEDVADILIDDDAARRALGDGDDSWDRGNCSVCGGYHIVVRTENEEYVCACCFEVSEWLERCKWCNDPNNGDMELSHTIGCGHCDGESPTG